MTEMVAINEAQINELLELASTSLLQSEDIGFLVQWARRWLHLKEFLQQPAGTYKELKALLLGEVEEKKKPGSGNNGNVGKAGSKGDGANPKKVKKKKKKGHGHLGVKDYPGAKKVHVHHPRLKPGDECPCCVSDKKARLQRDKPSRPQSKLRLSGTPPITGTVYFKVPLYCPKCDTKFIPEWPEDAQKDTYDASAKATIALFRHWYGFPAFRLEKLQAEQGVPVPDSTQSDLNKETVRDLEPLYEALLSLAARGELFIFDDTSVRILSLIREGKLYPDLKRNAAHITGIIAYVNGRPIYTYRVGTQHAGENFQDLLERRPAGLPVPLQMSDALAVNTDHEFQTIVAYCLQHARKGFVEVESYFPVECTKVLDLFSQVFNHDTVTKKAGMTDLERLAYHRIHSRPLMDELFTYLRNLREKNLIEENGSMNKAVNYMLKRREELCRFLEIPGAPLSSNAVERALKHAVLIRKNSLFYHNEISAYDAGVIMTIIATSVHNGENPLAYLTAVLENSGDVAVNPEAWLPWCYRERLAELESATRIAASQQGDPPMESQFPVEPAAPVATSEPRGRSPDSATIPACL